MPKVIIQTDEGVTVDQFEFPVNSAYALLRMPGCPTHVGVHNLLNWLGRTLEDACNIQEKAERIARANVH